MITLPTIFQTIGELASQYFVWLLFVSALFFAGSLAIAWLLILRLPAQPSSWNSMGLAPQLSGIHALLVVALHEQ